VKLIVKQYIFKEIDDKLSRIMYIVYIIIKLAYLLLTKIKMIEIEYESKKIISVSIITVY